MRLGGIAGHCNRYSDRKMISLGYLISVEWYEVFCSHYSLPYCYYIALPYEKDWVNSKTSILVNN